MHPTLFCALDKLFADFLHEINLDSRTAFLDFRLAPLCLRRDIAMLGFLHKCVLGFAHPALCRLFPSVPAEQSQRNYSTRLASRRHNKQLLERCQGPHIDMLGRSIFGLTRVYNLLPQEVVLSTSVKDFQHKLTVLARTACERCERKWSSIFSPR